MIATLREETEAFSSSWGKIFSEKNIMHTNFF